MIHLTCPDPVAAGSGQTYIGQGYAMRIAVTGAAGRLGGQVAEILAATGDHQVVAVSRRPAAGPAPGPRLTAAVAGYADLPALRAALRGVDTLVFVSSAPAALHLMRHPATALH